MFDNSAYDRCFLRFTLDILMTHEEIQAARAVIVNAELEDARLGWEITLDAIIYWKEENSRLRAALESIIKSIKFFDKNNIPIGVDGIRLQAEAALAERGGG